MSKSANTETASDALKDAPFVPDLCQGCANLALPCSKLPAILREVGNVQLSMCGIYRPLPKKKES